MKFPKASCLPGIVALVLLLAWGPSVLAQEGSLPGGGKVKILFPGGDAVAALYDNPLAVELVRRLPLEVEFSDFAGVEKIFYLSEKLPLAGAVNADMQKGDFCYYAPWGNIAVFYKGYGHGTHLYVVGNIESGKEKLAEMEGNFKARIEVLKEKNGAD